MAGAGTGAGDERIQGQGPTQGGRHRTRTLATAGAVLALSVGLTGCATSDKTNADPAPSATPSPSTSISERQQQIAAAEKALREYEAAFDEASRDLDSDDLTLMKMTTPKWWSEEIVPELNRSHELKEVLTGNTELVSVRPVKVDLDGSQKSVKFRVCKDVSDLRYVKAEGKNKGKVTYDPNDGDTPRFEMTSTFTYSEELNRWRLSHDAVPLDENGNNTPC